MFNPRLSPLAHAVTLASTVLVAAAAFAPAAGAASSPYYRATLASPAPEARFVSRDVVWSCDGADCVAARGSSRPLIMCMSLVKEAGAVASFTAGGKALEADELARCNGEG